MVFFSEYTVIQFIFVLIIVLLILSTVMDKVDIEGAINVADLSPEQQQVLYFIVIKGENVFVTGGGGTGIYTSFHDFKGKSFLVSLIVKNSILKGLNVAITAPTATAAILINGQTIHHWSGVGLGQDSPEELVKLSHLVE